MPRSRPAKSIALLLPPISSLASSSSSSSTHAISDMTTEHKIEVLLHARRLASERGQYLDIMSFMTPAERDRYLVMIGRASPRTSAATSPPAPSTPIPPPTSAKRPLEQEYEVPLPIQEEHQSTPPATTITSPLDSPSLSQPALPPKKPRIPDLSHLHWKQRQKRLAMLAAGEIGEDSELLAEKEKDPPGTPAGIGHHGRGKGEVDKEAIQSSASYWNHLLVQARQSRGPQWDYNTQSYQIDPRSKEHYTHVSKPRSDGVKAEAPRQGVVNGQLSDYQTRGGDIGRAMRTSSTGRVDNAPRCSAGINGGYIQAPRLPPHLQSGPQQYAPSPLVPAPPPQPQPRLQQYQPRQQQQPPQQHYHYPNQSPQPQTQPQPQSQPYQTPRSQLNPAQLNQLQLAQMGGLNPITMQQMARTHGGSGPVGGGGLGQGTNPASLGGVNLAALSGLPGMSNMGGGSGMMAGVNRMQMMNGGTLNPLGQHGFGGGQGQGPMLSSGAGSGPMIGGGSWEQYGSA